MRLSSLTFIFPRAVLMQCTGLRLQRHANLVGILVDAPSHLQSNIYLVALEAQVMRKP
jgi:hypothetical protein